ncbi:MAG: hypothetical protein HQ488_02930 [Parcubacteria group bacterium]|nr:hypothetical protein [Parcubacteria group bacterium]
MFRDALEGMGAFDAPDTKTRLLGQLTYIWCRPVERDLVTLTAAALCREIDEVLIKDVREHIDSAQDILAVYKGAKLVGYMLIQVLLGDVLYIAGTMVHPSCQGMGIKAQATVDVMKIYTSCKYFAGRTQSSIVWASVTRAAVAVLPSHTGTSVEKGMIDARQSLVDVLMMEGSVHRGFYGGPLYGEKPTHRDPTTQAWWDTFIDFERGDAVLYIAML